MSAAGADAEMAVRIEIAFLEDFDPRGRPGVPYIANGLLMCPGGMVESFGSHRCRFVSVDGIWCFERADQIVDEIRWAPWPKRSMRSITILKAVDGQLVESVSARLVEGAHELIRAQYWQVVDGALESVGRRIRRRDVSDWLVRWPKQRESQSPGVD
jgi:hypothetical protein